MFGIQTQEKVPEMGCASVSVNLFCHDSNNNLMGTNSCNNPCYKFYNLSSKQRYNMLSSFTSQPHPQFIFNPEASSCGLKTGLSPYLHYLKNNGEAALIFIPLKGLKAAL